MKKLLNFSLFLSICLMPQAGKAQLNRQWLNEYSTPDTAYMNVIGLFDAGNGNVIKATLITKYSPPSDSYNRLKLQKISSAGSVIWEENYQHPVYEQFNLYNGGMDQQGNMYFSGQLTISQQDAEWFVISFDSNGQERWQKSIVENIYSSGGSQKCVTDANGNTYVSGNVGDVGLSLGAIVKYDNMGNEQWVKYDTTSYSYGADMVLAANGDLIACDGQFELTRFAPNGQVLWITPDTADFVYVTPRITEAPDGSIYALSFLNYSYSLKKLNANGVFQWNQTQFAQNLVFGDYSLGILADSENAIYLSGINSTDPGEYQTAVFKFNPSGAEIWRQEFTPEIYEVTDLILLPNGNPVLAASTGAPYFPEVYLLNKQTGTISDSDSLPSGGNESILLYNQSGLFMASNGNFATVLAHYDNTLSIGENEEDAEVLIYPNPFSEEITVTTKMKEAKFECLDLSGKMIHHGGFSMDANIQLPNLAPGTYILKVTDKDGQFVSRRIVKS